MKSVQNSFKKEYSRMQSESRKRLRHIDAKNADQVNENYLYKSFHKTDKEGLQKDSLDQGSTLDNKPLVFKVSDVLQEH